MPTWTEDLATGIEAIDAQHQELYAQVGVLRQAMREGRLERVPEVLSFLERYAVEHFDTEERAMAAAGYPGLAEHRLRHRDFVVEFLRQRAAAGTAPSISVVVELSAWLGSWLRQHVRTVDGDMARFLKRTPGRAR